MCTYLIWYVYTHKHAIQEVCMSTRYMRVHVCRGDKYVCGKGSASPGACENATFLSNSTHLLPTYDPKLSPNKTLVWGWPRLEATTELNI